MKFIRNVLVVLAISVWGLWLAIRPANRAEASLRVRAHVVGKVPVAETAAVFERIDQMTMSAASAAGHPLDLLVDVQGQTVSCRCAPDRYKQARVGDELTVAIRNTHCYVPDGR